MPQTLAGLDNRQVRVSHIDTARQGADPVALEGDKFYFGVLFTRFRTFLRS